MFIKLSINAAWVRIHTSTISGGTLSFHGHLWSANWANKNPIRTDKLLHFITEKELAEEESKKKEKLPPKAPKEKPVIFDITHNSLKLTWLPSEIPAYAEQTSISYIVEKR